MVTGDSSVCILADEAIVIAQSCEGVTGNGVVSTGGVDINLSGGVVDVVNGGIALVLNNYIIDGSFGVVICQSTCNSGFTVVVQVSTVVTHLGVQQLLHGVDVGVSVDSNTVLPLHVGVQLNLEDIAGSDVLSGLALGQSDLVLSQFVLVGSGNVLNGSCSLEGPLEFAGFGILNGHADQGGLQVTHNALIGISFPSVGVPVGTQSGCVGLVSIAGTQIDLFALTCGEQRNDHDNSQHKCKQFFHFHFLLKILFTHAIGQ